MNYRRRDERRRVSLPEVCSEMTFSANVFQIISDISRIVLFFQLFSHLCPSNSTISTTPPSFICHCGIFVFHLFFYGSLICFSLGDVVSRTLPYPANLWWQASIVVFHTSRLDDATRIPNPPSPPFLSPSSKRWAVCCDGFPLPWINISVWIGENHLTYCNAVHLFHSGGIEGRGGHWPSIKDFKMQLEWKTSEKLPHT